VQQSRDRISILERYLGQEMFSVTRNRKDIDAFVVFANAKQTELINPMIEASISTFSDDIQPVFASSRSYNHKLNKNSLRDLQNVIFIDMPWLLDETLNVELLTQYETVFGEASTAQKRLFAFGYDALNLIGKIQPLQKVQGLLLPGLTGSLAINDKNQVTRTLPRAKITTRQIERLTSE
jgi:outer membrane PBP1 activator LpoA protein